MKRIRKLTSYLAVPLVLIFTACSTTSTINTNPPGAKVYLSNQYVGESPVTVELEDGLLHDGYFVRLEKDGYKPQRFKLLKPWSGGYIALDVFVCLITLGLGCPLVVVNGQAHLDNYSFTLDPDETLQSHPVQVAPVAPSTTVIIQTPPPAQ